jgi:alginate O-acetyltransferase complex protein AlgI
MVFSSITFLVFFLPLVLITYSLTPNKFKNVLLLLSSIIFYAWGAPRFIFVILFTTAFDFFIVKKMYDEANLTKRKLLLLLSLCINLGLLFYFKYFNFFIENINWALHSVNLGSFHSLNIILPIGISFYTFESITYIVDVYRRVHSPLKRFWDYQLYIIFFPKLIAGPIVRYHDIASQIAGRFSTYTVDDKIIGLNRFFIGLAKKVLIANVVGKQADLIFSSNIADISSVEAWVGALAYTMQIYFDFSGYSDMAIGLSRFFGFVLPENFNNPYTSKSITEFWRKWHISLGSWMRNYLYLPLGGNRVENPVRLYLNLFTVFFVSGLWHGATWMFIIWGIYHGIWIVIERLIKEENLQKIPSLIRLLITFIIVVLGWVFFRIESVSDGWLYLHKMFAFSMQTDFVPEKSFYFILILAFLFSFSNTIKIGGIIEDRIYLVTKPSFFQLTSVLLFTFVLFILSLAAVTSSSFNPFIYFRF